MALLQPPDWAVRQLEAICARAQVALPELEWYRSTDDVGVYRPQSPKITISETYESGHRQAAEITFLHELAHHLTHQIAHRSSHCAAFWEICWRLYLDQGVPLDLAVYGECSYHHGAEKALRSLVRQLDAKVEAAAAYGAACRRLDRLETKIHRFSAQGQLQSNLEGLRAHQSRMKADAAQHLRAWLSA